jgi:hypothetical protein
VAAPGFGFHANEPSFVSLPKLNLIHRKIENHMNSRVQKSRDKKNNVHQSSFAYLSQPFPLLALIVIASPFLPWPSTPISKYF